MQLHFAPDELNLLADLLLNQGDPDGLLDRIMARDLRFDSDELDRLRDILIANQDSAKFEASVCKDPALRKNLEAREVLLETMIEKVSEACAML